MPSVRGAVPASGGERDGVTMSTAAEILIDRLIDWEVSVIFGLPGDGINGLIEALRTNRAKLP